MISKQRDELQEEIKGGSFFDQFRKRTNDEPFPPMKNSTRTYLEYFFRPYNEQLENFLLEKLQNEKGNNKDEETTTSWKNLWKYR